MPGSHGHAADGILTDVLLDLDDEDLSVRTPDIEAVVDPGKFPFRRLGGDYEMDIDDRADDLRNMACWY